MMPFKAHDISITLAILAIIGFVFLIRAVAKGMDTSK
jgi:hypothetical protein